MTGAFIIEGQYDDDLNTWYGVNWTRTQPVIVINQLGASPNLMRGSGGQQDKGPDFSVNGQLNPVISMKPGEVQMWRIVNTSGRAGAYFLGPPNGFQWKQLAQDGVQFQDAVYQQSLNNSFLMMAGNRVDLLVKAPTTPGTYPVQVKNEVDQSDLFQLPKINLMSVAVSGSPVAPSSNGAAFIAHAPTPPPYLRDIDSIEVTGKKEITFSSTGSGSPFAVHKINGKQFDGDVGEVVLLNTVEEWKVINETYANAGPAISHPFHIHINPFQVVEVFAPFQILTDNNGNPLIQTSNTTGSVILDTTKSNQPLPAHKYVFVQDYYNPEKYPGQCYLDPGKPDSWKPCGSPAPTPRVWWDTFPIPTGVAVLDGNFNPVIDPKTGKQVVVPGYFKMRSRFVDFPGFYVIHCHILAHEDRGMMTIVEVAPVRSPYSHN